MLSLHYQPQVSFTTGRPIGVEALLRWAHPVRGAVPPAEFIAEVEQSALMGDLTHWVVDEAIARPAGGRQSACLSGSRSM